MKLSEAMMMASMSGEAKREGAWECCAIGLSVKAAGVFPEVLGYRHLPTIGWADNHIVMTAVPVYAKPVAQVAVETWPWLNYFLISQVSSRFEHGHKTIAELAMEVARIEPECGECNRFKCVCVPADWSPVSPEVIAEKMALAE